MRYKIYEATGGCVHEADFADDEEALAFAASLDLTYTVEEQAASYQRVVTLAPVPASSPLNWKAQLTEQWKALPLLVRADFAPIRAAVFVAIDDGDFELARHLVGTALVPEELEPVRHGLLAGLPQ